MKRSHSGAWLELVKDEISPDTAEALLAYVQQVHKSDRLGWDITLLPNGWYEMSKQGSTEQSGDKNMSGNHEDLSAGLMNLLRSYEKGPKIWDAASILPDVYRLAERGLITPLGSSGAHRLTDAGCAVLQAASPVKLVTVTVAPWQPEEGQRPTSVGDIADALQDLATQLRIGQLANAHGANYIMVPATDGGNATRIEIKMSPLA